MKAKRIEVYREFAKRKARKSLLPFTQFTMEGYRANWHHKEYAGVLDKFIEGKIKRLMVFMPPQHGKSELCSRRMPAKILGNYPDKRVAVVAYNHTFASKFNRDIQRIITSKEYGELYPETSLNKRNVRSDASGSWLRNNDEFEVVGRKGSLISVGIGGGLTGNKVDVAVIDDPYKDAQQANSQAYRDHLREWWDTVLETRLNNEAQICLTFTRWRHDDIAGYLLDLQKKGVTTDEWVVVRFEGLREDMSISNHLNDPRKEGEALWPEEHNEEKLNNVKAKNPLVFEALYQQRPTPKSGNVVKREWFKNYEIHELPKGANHVYMDTAQSEQELKTNDPTGILVFREWNRNLYLIHFEKGRWSLPELCRKVEDLASIRLSGRSSKIHIENKSNAMSVKATLEEDTNLSIILDNIKGGKMERLENELPVLESGRVYIPLSENWSEDFLLHVCGFPLMTHDEEVDVLTGAIRKTIGREDLTGTYPQPLW